MSNIGEQLILQKGGTLQYLLVNKCLLSILSAFQLLAIRKIDADTTIFSKCDY